MRRCNTIGRAPPVIQNPHRFIPGSAACVTLLLACEPCPAQSFDCAKAKSDMENVICGHRFDDLGQIDREMGETYQTLLRITPASERTAVRQAQWQWIEKRDKDCMAVSGRTQEGCLKDAIGRRNDDLEDRLAQRLSLSPKTYKWIKAFSYAPMREIQAYAADVKDRLGRCSDLPPTLNAKFASLVPKDDEGLFSIATHRCDAVLRVYLHSNGETLILEDIANASARVLGELAVESRTGNSGGIFIPMAFTKDDKHIVLQVWMGDPGAGGGMVDYGYDVMARDGSTEKKAPLAPGTTAFYYGKDGEASISKTLFYDDFGRVVYTVNSPDLPEFTRPGPPSNSGRLMVKDLTTLKERRVLEEKDTTFEVLAADERNRTLTIRATKHSFTAICPRDDEGALYCSKKTIRERQIPLP